MNVLIDTSVWVDHFRRRNDHLVELLEFDRGMVHPLIVGELACGTPPDRIRTLAHLYSLRQVQQASMREVLVFIERERLFGQGCGLIDMMLLASTLLTPGVVLWTLDKRLLRLAERLDVAHHATLH